MIKVIPIGELAVFPVTEVEVSTIRQLFACLEHKYGPEIMGRFESSSVKHIIRIKDSDEFLPVTPEIFEIDLNEISEYYLIPEFSGEISGGMVIAALAYVGVSGVSSFTAGAIAFVANIAIGMALSAVVQALTPTPEFKNDPSDAQTKRSNLFNGALNVWNQGGSVPLCVGRCFAGGVIISAGIYAEET